MKRNIVENTVLGEDTIDFIINKQQEIEGEGTNWKRFAFAQIVQDRGTKTSANDAYVYWNAAIFEAESESVPDALTLKKVHRYGVTCPSGREATGYASISNGIYLDNNIEHTQGIDWNAVSIVSIDSILVNDQLRRFLMHNGFETEDNQGQVTFFEK